MAVAFDACTESHTGTTGSTSQASFTWTHTPAGTPRAIVVFTFVNANADDATSVTYGGTSMAAVTGGRAIDNAGEPRDCKAWFLGASVPTGNQTVQVNRNNNANVMYAVAVSMTAAADCRVSGTPAIVQGDGTLAEQAVDSGSQVALRLAAVNGAINAVPAAGSNSTATSMQSIDFGTNIAAVVRESSTGSGSRSCGFSDAGSDDRAYVVLAVAELVTIAPTEATLSLSGIVVIPNWIRFPSAAALTVAGQASALSIVEQLRPIAMQNFMRFKGGDGVSAAEGRSPW